MKINRKKTEVIICSKDPGNINIKMDKASTKIQVHMLYIYKRWDK